MIFPFLDLGTVFIIVAVNQRVTKKVGMLHGATGALSDSEGVVIEEVGEDGGGVDAGGGGGGGGGGGKALRLGISSLLQQGLLTDVVVKVPHNLKGGASGGWDSIRAHRVILAAASPVLRTMITSSDFADCGKGQLQLEDIDRATMELLIEFIYNGKVKVSSADSLLDVHRAADQLQISTLMKVWNRCGVCCERAKRCCVDSKLKPPTLHPQPRHA
jgi:hypothetical protein